MTLESQQQRPARATSTENDVKQRLSRSSISLLLGFSLFLALTTIDNQSFIQEYAYKESSDLFSWKNTSSSSASSISPSHLQALVCNSTTVESFGSEWKILCKGNFVEEMAKDMFRNQQAGAQIIQIGAHTGFEENDPFSIGILYLLNFLTRQERQERVHWTFVEPSPPNYKRLVQNVANYSQTVCDMTAVNVAVVSDVMKEDPNGLTFYSVAESIDPETGYDSKSGKQLPYFVTQISGFSMKPLLFNTRVWSRQGLNIHDYIVKTNVTTKRYSELMQDIVPSNSEEGKVEPPLFVLIDTEGFDCDIVLGISNSSSCLTKYLVFESHQCGAGKLPLTIQYLESLGYEVYNAEKTQNHVAMRQSPSS